MGQAGDTAPTVGASDATGLLGGGVTVFREGDSVRVDLRGDTKTGGFFQFWTGNPATAGTIVRLLPTTRTIEYDGATTGQAPSLRPPLSLHRWRRARRRFVSIALIVGLVTVGALLVTDIALRRTPVTGAAVAIPRVTANAAVATQVLPTATRDDVASALTELQRFDDRMDGLRAQFRTAFEALQSGHLSQDEFVGGIHQWLIPQWRALYAELAGRPQEKGSLTAAVTARLMDTALGWDRGLQDYAEGLQAHSYNAVIAAFDRMTNGNESRREAWRLLERAEIELTTRPR